MIEAVIGWCIDCGNPLSQSHPDAEPETKLPKACPRCGRAYDPSQSRTHRQVPPRWTSSPWRTHEAFWGCAALASVLGWRICLNVLGRPLFDAVEAASGNLDPSAMVAAGVVTVLGVLFVLGILLPTGFCAVCLVLVAASHVGEGLVARVALGMGVGLTLCLGLPAPWMIGGMIAGALAGLTRRWWELSSSS